MNLNIEEDIWTYLRCTDKKKVIYGMGNGADKVIAMCEKSGIEIGDFYASDAFVRGQQFHGKTVLTYGQIREKYGDGNFISLLSFATRLPDVIDTIKSISNENELYAPDVPVFGDNVFDFDFYKRYKDDMEYVHDSLLADEISKQAYRDIIAYKLTGKIDYLMRCEHDRRDVFEGILHPSGYRSFADLGAYTGDTVRELIEYAPSLKYVFAIEPDRKNFKKLDRYAEAEGRCSIAALNMAAWSEPTTLSFDCSGNRNSNITNGAKKTVDIDANSLDNILHGFAVDYIKYDVEGAEMQALLGSAQTIKNYAPELCVSLYHRSEDIFLLPTLVNHLNPDYKLYLRRGKYLPAWDINLLAVSK